MRKCIQFLILKANKKSALCYKGEKFSKGKDKIDVPKRKEKKRKGANLVTQLARITTS